METLEEEPGAPSLDPDDKDERVHGVMTSIREARSVYKNYLGRDSGNDELTENHFTAAKNIHVLDKMMFHCKSLLSPVFKARQNLVILKLQEKTLSGELKKANTKGKLFEVSQDVIALLNETQKAWIHFQKYKAVISARSQSLAREGEKEIKQLFSLCQSHWDLIERKKSMKSANYKMAALVTIHSGIKIDKPRQPEMTSVLVKPSRRIIEIIDTSGTKVKKN
jgi:hypothetical protein